MARTTSIACTILIGAIVIMRPGVSQEEVIAPDNVLDMRRRHRPQPKNPLIYHADIRIPYDGNFCCESEARSWLAEAWLTVK